MRYDYIKNNAIETIITNTFKKRKINKQIQIPYESERGLSYISTNTAPCSW